MPSEECAEIFGEPLREVGLQLMEMPPTPRGVQAHTVLFTRHAAESEQAPKWGHVVMPGVS